MPDFRKWKGLLILAVTLVLLSFFYSSPIFAETRIGGLLQAEAELTHNAKAETVQLTSGQHGAEADAARISLPKTLMEDVMTKEQRVMRTLLERFWIVAFVLTVVECVFYRGVIRRYGHHMIALWENINYIHEVDGKKGERFSVYIAA